MFSGCYNLLHCWIIAMNHCIYSSSTHLVLNMPVIHSAYLNQQSHSNSHPQLTMLVYISDFKAGNRLTLCQQPYSCFLLFLCFDILCIIHPRTFFFLFFPSLFFLHPTQIHTHMHTCWTKTTFLPPVRYTA